jgi:8-oxo-dGTP diphosphatase
MSILQIYVVGFAFNLERSSVLLVRKLRPKWQKGCLNGIGGKVEDGETHLEAMNRECLEESGLLLSWIYRGMMTGINNDDNPFEGHIYYAYGDIHQFKQKEDELLGVYPVQSLGGEKTLENLKWLIPFGISNDGAKFMKLDYDTSNESGA